jgi:hypothetical protein
LLAIPSAIARNRLVRTSASLLTADIVDGVVAPVAVAGDVATAAAVVVVCDEGGKVVLGDEISTRSVVVVMAATAFGSPVMITYSYTIYQIESNQLMTQLIIWK